MAGVLITGFEPFGGEAVNPSWEVVKQLDGAMVAGERVVARQLPCVFGEALTALYAALDEHQPVLTIAVGQAGGRVDITVERVAINVDDARIADNKGQQPVDVPVVADGPAARFSSLPVKAIVAALRERHTGIGVANGGDIRLQPCDVWSAACIKRAKRGKRRLYPYSVPPGAGGRPSG